MLYPTSGAALEHRGTVASQCQSKSYEPASLKLQEARPHLCSSGHFPAISALLELTRFVRCGSSHQMLATLLNAVMKFSSTERVFMDQQLLVKLSPRPCEPDSLGVGTAHTQEPGETLTCSVHLSAAAKGTQAFREQSAG